MLCAFEGFWFLFPVSDVRDLTLQHSKDFRSVRNTISHSFFKVGQQLIDSAGTNDCKNLVAFLEHRATLARFEVDDDKYSTELRLKQESFITEAL